MSSIGLAIGLVSGSALGLLLTDLYPLGLDPIYGMIALALALAALGTSLLALGDRRAVGAGLLTAFVLAGCGRALLIRQPVTPSDLSFYNGSPIGPAVSVTGSVSAEPVYSDRSQRLRISTRSIQLSADSTPIAIRGDMYANVPRYPEFDMGEVLLLSGFLTAPPSFSDFDYATYLSRQSVFSYMSFPKVASLGHTDEVGPGVYIVGQRAAARRILQSALPEPEASIAVGVVTGDRSSLSDPVQLAFRRSGTTHILAISGENISLLTALLTAMAQCTVLAV